MQLNAFESHGMWQRLAEIEDQLGQLRASDNGVNIDLIDEMQTRGAQIRAAYTVRRRLAPLVVPQQLEGVDSQLPSWLNSLQSAISYTDSNRAQYLNQAVQYAQNATATISTWPSAHPTTVEERLEVAVVDELLARTGVFEQALKEKFERVNQDIEQANARTAQVTAAIEASERSIAAAVTEAAAAVSAEKARIATVIDEGNAKIAGFDAILAKSLKDWQAERSAKFVDELAQLRADQLALLDGARNKFEELTRVVGDYEALVQADSADRLALHYEQEAAKAQKDGKRTNAWGFVLLIAAAIPLLLVVLQPLWAAIGIEVANPTWESLVARAGVAAVFVGAATVAIRLGSADLRRAADYKRLAMELRTMGPFLAAVSDGESVDQARLDLVNRTFGQAYVPSRDEKPEDAVPVTVLQQLLTLLTKTVSR